MSRRKKKLAAAPELITIDRLNHEGLGVGRIDGKVVFVHGALPGETARIQRVKFQRQYDIAQTLEVITPSAQRVTPVCEHFLVCGGCAMQHLAGEEQIKAKQQILLDNLRQIGKVTPERVLEPLTGPQWGYRRKARLGVRYVEKKGKLLVGFREKNNRYLADLERCPVLHASVGERLRELADLIASLEGYEQIAQIEVSIGDETRVLVFRNLAPLSDTDLQKLRAYAQGNGFVIYLQPAGPDSQHPLDRAAELYYAIPEENLKLYFLPSDFTQVNVDINRSMIALALQLLELKPDEHVLDLFCGLGNFTLALARHAAHVVGVEGEAGLVQRGRDNAQRNGIDNAEFHVTNLFESLQGLAWAGRDYHKLLLDPPRTGALEVVSDIDRLDINRIVYVSCNPATLARDAGILVNDKGYKLEAAGVMDMFPHTAHVESIALFTRSTRK